MKHNILLLLQLHFFNCVTHLAYHPPLHEETTFDQFASLIGGTAADQTKPTKHKFPPMLKEESFVQYHRLRNEARTVTVHASITDPLPGGFERPADVPLMGSGTTRFRRLIGSIAIEIKTITINNFLLNFKERFERYFKCYLRVGSETKLDTFNLSANFTCLSISIFLLLIYFS